MQAKWLTLFGLTAVVVAVTLVTVHNLDFNRSHELLNVSPAPTGELYQAINRQFAEAYWPVSLLGASATDSRTTFAYDKLGDVHLTWENEAIQEVADTRGKLELVYPPSASGPNRASPGWTPTWPGTNQRFTPGPTSSFCSRTRPRKPRRNWVASVYHSHSPRACRPAARAGILSPHADCPGLGGGPDQVFRGQRHFRPDLPTESQLNMSPDYSWNSARKDFLAGLIVAAISLPQAMAYALIAGVDPRFGLFSGIVGTAVAAIFGSSSHLINGPANAISLVVFSALAFFDPDARLDAFQALFLPAIMVGIIQIFIAIFRLGDLTCYISEAVVIGFMAGASLLIAIGQVANFLGLHGKGAGHQHVLLRLWNTVTHGGPVNFYALGSGVGTICNSVGLLVGVSPFLAAGASQAADTTNAPAWPPLKKAPPGAPNLVLGFGEPFGDLTDARREDDGLLLDEARLSKRVCVKKRPAAL